MFLRLRVTTYLMGLQRSRWDHDFMDGPLNTAIKRFKAPVDNLIGSRYDTVVGEILDRAGNVLHTYKATALENKPNGTK